MKNALTTTVTTNLLAFVTLLAAAGLLPLSLQVGQAMIATAASTMVAQTSTSSTRPSPDIVVAVNVR